jgi:hypothetical protein
MMRNFTLAAAGSLALGFVGCTSEGGSPPPGGDGADAGRGGPGAGDAAPTTGELPPPEQGFQILTPDIEIGPSEEVTYCYFTTVPIEQAAGVARWESRMTPGSHHLILYFTSSLGRPEGTLTEACDISSGGLDVPVWVYASQKPESRSPMPAGVGMDVAARQPAVVQMHYLNTSDQALVASVAINGHTYGPGESYLEAAPYITFNTEISVPPGQSSSVSGSCPVDGEANFFTLSTHSHRFSTQTRVRDGQAMVVESDNWEDPEAREWPGEPFFHFASGTLTYECEYFNFTDQTVNTGDSAETDEMCMAVGYFFPADRAVFCVNSYVVPF